MSQSVSHSVSQSLSQSVTQSVSQSLSQSASQSVSPLIPSCPSLHRCQHAAMNYTSRLAGELAALGDGDPLFGQQKERDDAWTYFTLRGVD